MKDPPTEQGWGCGVPASWHTPFGHCTGHSTTMSVHDHAIAAAPHLRDVEAVSLLAKSHNKKGSRCPVNCAPGPSPTLIIPGVFLAVRGDPLVTAAGRHSQLSCCTPWLSRHLSSHPSIGSSELITSDVTTAPSRSSPLHHPPPPGSLQKNIRQTFQSAFSVAQVHR